MLFEMPSCGGCRTCEMACSFHHKGEFIPAISSIKILDKERVSGYDVFFAEKSDADHMACDGCRQLSVPLCMEYCTKSKDLEKILDEFLEKGDQRKSRR
jgi:Fe-S-cluster-containing hydrogenase component 2